MRYVVASTSSENSMRIFGTFRDRERADALADKVNAELTRIEDAEFQTWQAEPYEEKNNAPEAYGRAYVLIIHKPSYRRALRFAMGELDS